MTVSPKTLSVIAIVAAVLWILSKVIKIEIEPPPERPDARRRQLPAGHLQTTIAAASNRSRSGHEIPFARMPKTAIVARIDARTQTALTIIDHYVQACGALNSLMTLYSRDDELMEQARQDWGSETYQLQLGERMLYHSLCQYVCSMRIILAAKPDLEMTSEQTTALLTAQDFIEQAHEVRKRMTELGLAAIEDR